MEFVKEINGIIFINDTTATNPTATMNSISSSTRPIILIAGGTDKNLSYKSFVEYIQKRVKAVILLPGSATEKIKQLIIDRLSRKVIIEKTAWYETHNLEEAVLAAFRVAESGDSIILSPAAASFSLLSNKSKRGNAFVKAVNNLISR